MRSDSQTIDMQLLSQIQLSFQKRRRRKKKREEVQSGMGCPACHVSLLDINLPELLRVFCPGQARIKENDQADRLGAKQPSQVACVSENLKC